jgi:photosystem II stability/assembly factor-like uncharacterized protein
MKKLLYVLCICTIAYSCDSDDTISEKNPLITNTSPEFIEAGTEVSIEGTDLNDSPTLFFNGQTIAIKNITANAITFDMPENASSGRLLIEFEQAEFNNETYLKILDTDWAVNQTDNYTQIQFVSNTTGFATIVDGTVNQRRIDKTTDGGTTWTTIFQEDVGGFYFTAVNANVIYAKGNSNVFKRTTNGGVNWENLTILDVSYLVTDLFFINESSGFLLADKLGDSYLFKTNDGGNTWEQKLVMNVPTNKIEVAYKNENSVSLLNKQTNELIKTSDDGETWTTSELNIVIENRFLDSNFISEQNSWLSLGSLIENPGGLYNTNNIDSGWEAVEIPMLSDTTEKIIKIAILNDLEGSLITDQGGHLYTDDGGETWMLRYLDINNISATYNNESSVFIIANGQLLKR